MRLYFCLLCYLLIILGNFFCSNSPFDSTTDLGSNIIKDQDSLLTIFDGEICEAVLTIDPIDSSVSFVDMIGENQSGINALTPLALGSWDNLSSIAFFKFDADSFNSFLNDGNEFHSLTFDFSTDTVQSNTNSNVEIGFCNNKPDSEKINSDSLWEIAHYSLNANTNGSHSTIINGGHIDSSDTVISKTTSCKNTNGYIKTIEMKMVLDSIFDLNKTVSDLSSLGKDMIVIDYNDTAKITIQTIISPSDTTYDTTISYDTISYDLGYIVYKDTTIYDSTSTEEVIVYDSIAPISSLIQEGQEALYSFSPPDTIIVSDNDSITIHLDSVVTTPDTTVNHTINTKVTKIIQNGVIKEIIQYDTVYSLTTITQDTVIQKSTTLSQKTLKKKFFSDSLQWDIEIDTVKDSNGNILKNSNGMDSIVITITKNICFYTQLDSAGDNSLQFIKDVHLTYTSLERNDTDNTIIEDTIKKVLYPSHFDYSVFESNSNPHEFTNFTSGAAGRYVRMALDMKPLRDKILDSTGNIVYKNIPKAVLTIFPDSLFSHNSVGTSVNTQYTLSTKKMTDIDNVLYDSVSIPYLLSSSISTTTDSLNIQLHTFLIDILHSEKTIPETCYLYLGLFRSNFAHLKWKTPDTGFPIKFIISNSQ